ncbi:MAG: class I SAM-dependent methyltransferase [Candidatus Pacebacteria bacterium]|nr:class I SAM-dependent methyltransferase [Candidatus Paceibacterota bacterium]
MVTLELSDIEKMSYVQLLANIKEVNRPPGGKDSIRRIVQNCFLRQNSKVLDVGCNTGYTSFEITHLAHCFVTGVDISPEMIKTANEFKEKDAFKKFIDFKVADGMNLPFDDESFDLTMSGGSTAFIKDKIKALKEYTRVTKTWGFVADINFYYKNKVPTKLINDLNTAMEIDIKQWDKDYWLKVYEASGLEMYHIHCGNVHVSSVQEIKEYCTAMTNTVDATTEARKLIKEKLIFLMTLFSHNHQHLEYGIFILRKRNLPEQISLFGA